MADFATRLRELRKGGNLRQLDLANALGVAQTTIANYEQHSRFPDEETLGKIASHFNVSLDYLLGRSEAKTASEPLQRVAENTELSSLARDYLEILLEGRKSEAYERIMEEVRGGTPVLEIYRSVFEPSLKEVGRLWERNEIDVADEHYFSAATESLMGQLYPYLDRASERRGVVVSVAIGGELHEIGIRMVSDALEAAGWDSYYLGVNTPTANVFRAIVERKASVLAISATMPSVIDSVANMIEHIRSAETKEGSRNVRIIVGGRAFVHDHEAWKRVGADGCGRNADEAVKLVTWLERVKTSR